MRIKHLLHGAYSSDRLSRTRFFELGVRLSLALATALSLLGCLTTGGSAENPSSFDSLFSDFTTAPSPTPTPSTAPSSSPGTSSASPLCPSAPTVNQIYLTRDFLGNFAVVISGTQLTCAVQLILSSPSQTVYFQILSRSLLCREPIPSGGGNLQSSSVCLAAIPFSGTRADEIASVTSSSFTLTLGTPLGPMTYQVPVTPNSLSSLTVGPASTPQLNVDGSSQKVSIGYSSTGLSSSPSGVLEVYGSTTTQSATAMRVMNSETTDLMSVRNDGAVTFGNLSNTNGSITLQPPSSSMTTISNPSVSSGRKTLRVLGSTYLKDITLNALDPKTFGSIEISPNSSSIYSNISAFHIQTDSSSSSSSALYLAYPGSSISYPIVLQNNGFLGIGTTSRSTTGPQGLGEIETQGDVKASEFIALSQIPSGTTPDATYNEGTIYLGGDNILCGKKCTESNSATICSNNYSCSCGTNCSVNYSSCFILYGIGYLCNTTTRTCSNLKLTDGTTQCFHTGIDCLQTSQGGANGVPQIDTIRKKPFCKFVGSSCPTGWTQLANWSTTQANSCWGGSTTGCTDGSSCSTASHTFNDAGIETCTPRRDLACGPAQVDGSTCYASRTEIGCY